MPSSTFARAARTTLWLALNKAPATAGICLLLASGGAHAQFGGFLQGMIGAAAQQSANQSAQQAAAMAAAAAVSGQQPAATTASALNPAQLNAIAATAAAIPATDPEYQGLMAQSLVNVPVNQRAAMAPVIDNQVRQSIAARRLGYTLAPGAVAQGHAAGAAVNPVAQASVQNALIQGLGGRGVSAPGVGNTLAGNIAGDAGKAAAAGVLIQGLGSFFSSRSEPAPATPTSPDAPAP